MPINVAFCMVSGVCLGVGSGVLAGVCVLVLYVCVFCDPMALWAGGCWSNMSVAFRPADVGWGFRLFVNKTKFKNTVAVLAKN